MHEALDSTLILHKKEGREGGRKEEKEKKERKEGRDKKKKIFLVVIDVLIMITTIIECLLCTWRGCCFLAPSFVRTSFLSLLVITEPNWG
jgi:hypothetical protein